MLHCNRRFFLSFIVRVECRLGLPQPLITFVAPGSAEFVSYLPLFFSASPSSSLYFWLISFWLINSFSPCYSSIHEEINDYISIIDNHLLKCPIPLGVSPDCPNFLLEAHYISLLWFLMKSMLCCRALSDELFLPWSRSYCLKSAWATMAWRTK